MKNQLQLVVLAIVIGLSVIACPIAYVLVGPALNEMQMSVLRTLLLITLCSAAYCFIVGELTNNNSQMDKLWSILPAIYTWVITAHDGFGARTLIMAILATIWGARLTYNFGRKGAYSWKFWAGEEDYRWVLLRKRKEFQPRWKWVLFDLLFISTYQNVLVLMTTFPALVVMGNDRPLGIWDCVAAGLTLFFIGYETIADEQQWRFQTTKWSQIKAGKKLTELDMPYSLGFNTVGLWSVSRHPNYFAEQGTWASFYLFSIAAGLGIFNWTIIGALLLIILFQGSSAMAEEISAGKYPEYKRYCDSLFKFLPLKKWKG